MRGKINRVTVTLYVICAFAAIYLGWVDTTDAASSGSNKTWPFAAILVVLCAVIGLVRFALIYSASKKEKEEFVPVRSVKLEEAVEVENGKEKPVSDKVVLVHVDNVAKDKVVVRIFKEPVSVADCSGKVNN